MDINEIGAHLHIADLASKHGALLQGIYNESMRVLGEVNAELVKEQKARVEAARVAAEAKAQQDAEAGATNRLNVEQRRVAQTEASDERRRT